jgi:GR25 family glycosyltransferase involved in LPS biosynthesis
MENLSFYCINYKDEVRKGNMIKRFDSINLKLHFVEPVENDDTRLQNAPSKRDLRVWSIMLQHLDSIRHFLVNTTNEYCVVCEDDILVSKNIVNDLPEIINTFNKLELDVLLLGYLLPFKIYDWFTHFPLKYRNDKYSFYDFPNDLWGSQMYMISRKHAEYLVDKYTIEYAIYTVETEPFSPDWTLTKNGKKSILYPMIALEEGDSKSGLNSQEQFHYNCYQTNFDADVYI